MFSIKLKINNVFSSAGEFLGTFLWELKRFENNTEIKLTYIKHVDLLK